MLQQRTLVEPLPLVACLLRHPTDDRRPALGARNQGQETTASLKGSSSGAGADDAAECELDAIARGQIDGFRVGRGRDGERLWMAGGGRRPAGRTTWFNRTI
jgi:hypothetical protein